MKVNTLLFILAFATPALALPKRKRVFKVYTPDQIQRLEDQKGRMLKKTKQPKPAPNKHQSMSMPSGIPSISPMGTITTATTTTTFTTTTTTTDRDDIATTPATMVDTPSPTFISVPSPPTPAPMRVMDSTDATTPPTPVDTPLTTSSRTLSPTPLPTPLPTFASTAAVTTKATTDSPTDATATVITPSPSTSDEEEETMVPTTSPVEPPTPDLPAAGATAALQAPNGAMALGTTLSAMAMVVCVMIFV